MRTISLVASSALAAALLVALPAPAQAVPPPVAGFVVGMQPGNMNYFPATGKEYNSAGMPIHISRPVAGTYRVTFFGIGVPNGVAHVSAYLSNSLCTVAAYGPMGANLVVDVRCYNNAGALIDSRFALNVTNRRPLGVHFGFLLNDNPVPPLGGHTPAKATSYDSTGAPITVYRSGVGQYQVDLGAFSTDSPGPWAAGYLRVTPFAAAARQCQALDPALVADPSLIEVRCYNDAGAGVDTQFTLTYARQTPMLGGSGPRTTATVDLSGLVPVLRGWTSSYGAPPTVTVILAGTYEVVFPNAGHANGHALASIMGTPPAYCNIQNWWQDMAGDEHLFITCHDGNTGVANPAVLLNVSYIA